MRIAILSDPHGNSVALDAVLADIERHGGADGYWVLGDLCALGPDPIGVVERLRALPNAQFIRGNTDDWLARDFDFFDGEVSAETIPARVALSTTMAWTRGMLTSAKHMGWIADLPLEWRTTLPDGTRVLCVHAAPGTDDGPGFHPAYDKSGMQQRIANADADLVIVGHTHWPMSIQLGPTHLINASPISIQAAPDFRAKYVLLEADEVGYSAEFCYVPYDRDAIIAELATINHPAANYISNMVTNGLTAFTGSMTGDLTTLIPEAGVKFGRTSHD